MDFFLFRHPDIVPTPNTQVQANRETNRSFFYQIQTNYEIFIAISQNSDETHPNISKFRKVLFWDTDFKKINWQKNSKWIIQRAFEYGNSNEIKETIKFYGKDLIIKELSSIRDTWNAKNRNFNLKKYLNYDFEN